MSDACLPILVVAYGNDLAADDAFGPLVAEAVRAKAIEGVEVLNLGMKPAGLLDYLAGRRAVCVVDAARCDGLPPGTLIETDSPLSPWVRVRVRAGCEASGRFLALTPGPSPIGRGEFVTVRLVHDAALSTHGLAVADELELARRLGICPQEVRLVAVVAESVEVGRPAGDAVLRQVPVAASRIAQWANRLLALA